MDCSIRKCGAMNRQVHGHANNPSEYNAYSGAKQRCRCTTNKDYYNYGRRGIEFLFTCFEEFWKELGERPKGKVLDRINNNGPYAIGNVKWSTRSESNQNRRPSKFPALQPTDKRLRTGWHPTFAARCAMAVAARKRCKRESNA